jgi:hypothetical protein
MLAPQRLLCLFHNLPPLSFPFAISVEILFDIDRHRRFIRLHYRSWGRSWFRMRRHRPYRVGFPTNRALPPVSLTSVASPDSFALFLGIFVKGAGERTVGAGPRESARNGEESRRRAIARCD